VLPTATGGREGIHMRNISYQTDVHAALETVWKLLRDKVENPQGYVPGIVETKILERYDDGVLREVSAQGMVIRERVTLNEPEGTITYFMVEHPLFSGRVINRVVPTSVQNPVAPQRLSITVEWVPKDESAEKIIQENMPEQIQREVVSLKEMAEEKERSGS
jgi:acetylaranotin biosynthesis cluster protein L